MQTLQAVCYLFFVNSGPFDVLSASVNHFKRKLIHFCSVIVYVCVCIQLVLMYVCVYVRATFIYILSYYQLYQLSTGGHVHKAYSFACFCILSHMGMFARLYGGSTQYMLAFCVTPVLMTEIDNIVQFRKLMEEAASIDPIKAVVQQHEH